MSYAAAADLQGAVFARLNGDATLGALVPGGVHDAPLPASPPGTYVVIGLEDVIDRSDVSGPGAEHRLTIQVVSDSNGFFDAKTAGARIDALMEQPWPPLAAGRVVACWFQDARARRVDGGDLRRLDLRYRLRLEL